MQMNEILLHLSNQWCAVHYDDSIYPGIILSADTESSCHGLSRSKPIQVACNFVIMHYDIGEVILPKPNYVTSIYVQIVPMLWSRMVDVAQNVQDEWM